MRSKESRILDIETLKYQKATPRLLIYRSRDENDTTKYKLKSKSDIIWFEIDGQYFSIPKQLLFNEPAPNALRTMVNISATYSIISNVKDTAPTITPELFQIIIQYLSVPQYKLPTLYPVVNDLLQVTKDLGLTNLKRKLLMIEGFPNPNKKYKSTSKPLKSRSPIEFVTFIPSKNYILFWYLKSTEYVTSPQSPTTKKKRDHHDVLQTPSSPIQATLTNFYPTLGTTVDSNTVTLSNKKYRIVKDTYTLNKETNEMIIRDAHTKEHLETWTALSNEVIVAVTKNADTYTYTPSDLIEKETTIREHTVFHPTPFVPPIIHKRRSQKRFK
mmetsp:Transcript_9495/g.14040  ORF Transcript_9495/g.14040 Transcript_9495/m.14040 type:complete len:329 (+) Transcript_9495:48-1034(+)